MSNPSYIFNSDNMKKFLFKTIIFALSIIAAIIILMLSPGTPRAKKSLLFGKIDKDSLVRNVKQPRIIFIGDSNLSMGLDCSQIKDSLGYNPINMSINAGIGMKYILDEHLDDLEPGDIVVTCFGYGHFYGDEAYGEETLLRTVFDVEPRDIRLLNWKQWYNIIPFIPKFAFSKLQPSEYVKDKAEHRVYLRNAYNEYGDDTVHWYLPPKKVIPRNPYKEAFDEDIVNHFVKFKENLSSRNIQLYVTYPGFQESSFNNMRLQIDEVDKTLMNKGFYVISRPENYIMPDSLVYDTPAHLVKAGIDIRTAKLIKDLRKVL